MHLDRAPRFCNDRGRLHFCMLDWCERGMTDDETVGVMIVRLVGRENVVASLIPTRDRRLFPPCAGRYNDRIEFALRG